MTGFCYASVSRNSQKKRSKSPLSPHQKEKTKTKQEKKKKNLNEKLDYLQMGFTPK